MNVAVIGTGYVGLTTGVTLAFLGHQVVCVDIDEGKVASLNRGELPIYEPGLPELLGESREHIRFTSEYGSADLEQADVVFITVGTPSNPDGSPDLTYVRHVSQLVGQHLGSRFTVIVNKSTVPIGSGNWVVSLIAEAYEAAKGRKPNGNFAVASNPEFLREGAAVHDSLYPNRIVVGATHAQAIDVMTHLYRPILNQDFRAPKFAPRPEGLSAVPFVTTDLASAESIKYASNAFLALKISYINEIAQLAERVGADITQIARGIGLDDRIGPRFLQAGLGWGGSCFGKDTAGLISTAREYGLSMPIVEAARQVNYRQRQWVVERLQTELKILKGRTIALLGLAFKPDTDDLRDAPALDIARLLVQRKARVRAHDPIALLRARTEHASLGICYCETAMDAVTDADAIVLVTEWPQYRDLPWDEIKGRMRNPLILDGRNFLKDTKLVALGFRYLGVGR